MTVRVAVSAPTADCFSSGSNWNCRRCWRRRLWRDLGDLHVGKGDVRVAYMYRKDTSCLLSPLPPALQRRWLLFPK